MTILNKGIICSTYKKYIRVCPITPYPILPILYIPATTADLPIYPDLLTVCNRSIEKTRAYIWFMADNQTFIEMPSVGRERI